MSEQLTQREINWIDGWIDALESADSDPYAVTILWKLVTAARGAHDAEQRAERAEELRDTLAGLLLDTRQEATNLRQAAQEVLDAVWRGENSRFTEACTQLRAALQSAPPASEPQRQKIDRRWEEYPTGTRAHAASGGSWVKRDDGHWKWQTPNDSGGAFPRPGGDAVAVTLPPADPAPADRPEPSEALDEAMNAVMYAAWSGKALPADKVNRHAHTIRQAFSQPAPAVPEHWSHKQPGLADQYRAEALACRRALGFSEASENVSPSDITQSIADSAQPSESPAVPDGRWGEHTPEVLADSQWIAGAKFGWNCGVSGDRVKLHRAIESRVQDRADAAAPTPTDDGESHDD